MRLRKTSAASPFQLASSRLKRSSQSFSTGAWYLKNWAA
ncbi:hypothetical protein SMICM304S_00824 [Streptomyces microflavus]